MTRHDPVDEHLVVPSNNLFSFDVQRDFGHPHHSIG